MKKTFRAITLVLILCLGHNGITQAQDFAKGADISWLTEMEATGKKFYNSEGVQTECMTLLKSLDMNAVRPGTLQLSNLKWETTNSFNLGFDLGFLDKYIFDINLYKKNTKDLLFPNVAISQISGFGSLSYINGGEMNNSGWEVNFYANNFIKTKDFGVDFSFNLSNYSNVLVDLYQGILDSYNGDFNYQNGSYLTRIQKGNSFGSIYGFKYKGVYKKQESEFKNNLDFYIF